MNLHETIDRGIYNQGHATAADERLPRNFRKRSFWWLGIILIISILSIAYWLVKQQKGSLPGTGTSIVTSPDAPIVPPSAKSGTGNSFGIQVPKNEMIAEANFTLIDLSTSEVKVSASNDVKAVSGYKEISTPKGERYLVKMPDGSTVWLNARSKLRYLPDYENDRKVELEGEAFFDIAKNDAKPFTVTSGAASIKVLGTRFNINGYRNEDQVKVTLSEGIVDATGPSYERIMSPGEQTVISPAYSSYHNEDTTYVTAWKEGLFDLRKVNVFKIMRELERWYDVKSVYSGPVPQQDYTLKASKRLSLRSMLLLLEGVGIHTVLNGETLTLKI